MDAAGNLYGATIQGGARTSGIVFKIDTSNNETVLYSFTGGGDGGGPKAGLVMDATGNLYGTTSSGGSGGRGTVFKIQMNQYAVLNGGNIFNGNQTVNGNVSATDVLGNGNGLTDLNAASIASGTANINISGNAATANSATNAMNAVNSVNAVNALNAINASNLGGVSATSYARLDIANFFLGEQTLAASTTGSASLNIPNTGVAPSSPLMGDLWLTAADAHFQFRDLNGTTQKLAFLSDITSQDSQILTTAENYTNTQVGTEMTRAEMAEASLGTAIGNETARAEAAEATKANLSGGNSFSGNQSINGSATVTGNETVSGNSATGSLTVGGGATITAHMSALFNPNFPALHPATCATASFTFTGISDGDTMALGVPNARMVGPGNFVYTAWSSASNTITIQACNVSGTSQHTAGTGSIRVDVWKH